MELLVLDTATERGFFAYIKDEEVLFASYLPFGLQESQKLLGMLHEQLKLQHLSLSTLNAVAVGVGPGSYTGIRIAATIGKMLSYSLKIPLVGLCTLQSFVPEGDGPFAVAIDAKIAGVYIQSGDRDKELVTFPSGPQVLPLEQAVEFLKNYPTILSPNVKPLQEKFKKHSPNHEWIWQETPPSPEQMARAADDKILRGETAADGELELLYMRKTQAEIEAEMRKKAI